MGWEEIYAVFFLSSRILPKMTTKYKKGGNTRPGWLAMKDDKPQSRE
jgi:hypothetical protein